MCFKKSELGAFLLAGLCGLILAPRPVQAQQPTGLPRLVAHDVSPPLRSIPPLPVQGDHRVIPLRTVPQAPSSGQTDPVVQLSAGTFTATTGGLNFDGVGQGAYGYKVVAAPPDTNGSAGATQFVQWVNLAFAVFNKGTGQLLYGPAAGKTLWQGFGIAACANNNDGDVIAQYDKAAGRWVLGQLSFTGGPPYYECIAVSTTSDATGTYNRYALQWVNNTFPDYPKIGVWPDAYYFTFNMFLDAAFFMGAQVCALDRSLLLSGGAPTSSSAQCFQLSSSYASLLPSDLDGLVAPPSGSPNFLLNLGSNSLNLWKFHADFSGSSTLTGPISIPVAAFNIACGGGTCIPQSGTNQQLDSLGDRLMYRLAYRNFGDHESLVVNHSVNPGGGGGRGKKSGGSTTGVSAVRWYELRSPNGTPTVFQQGTFAPDTNSRWMGSIAMDKVGDIAVGYSTSSGAMHPAVRFTGRVPTDPLGTLEGENSIFEGLGSQLPNLSRWGDYSSMSVDPVDDCTLWYTNEYLLANGTFNWSTRIASFKFPGCQ